MISDGVPRPHYQYAFTESRRFHYAQFDLSIMDFKWIFYFAQFRWLYYRNALQGQNRDRPR